MSEKARRRLEALEKETMCGGEPEYYIIKSFRDVDLINERIFHPKSDVIILTVVSDPRRTELSKALHEAVERKKEALRLGNYAPLFEGYPTTTFEEWSK